MFLLAGVALGCQGATDPILVTLHVVPVNARELVPWDSAYTAWTAELAQCLELDVGDPSAIVAAIRWAEVDAILTDPYQGAVVAWYIPRSDGGPLVYLLAAARNTGFVVKHELMHHLIDDPGHRDMRWRLCTEGP